MYNYVSLNFDILFELAVNKNKLLTILSPKDSSWNNIIGTPLTNN